MDWISRGKLFSVVLLLMILASCGSSADQRGAQIPADSPTPPGHLAEGERFGAPEVVRPRAFPVLSTRPCDLLAVREVGKKLEYRQPRERTIVTGNQSCSWRALSPRRSLSVILWDNRDYFVDVYRARLLPIFEPTTVGDLPAVEQRATADSVICTITVGLAPFRALDLQVSVNEVGEGPPVDPCAEGRRVAEVIVAALPPA